MKIWKYERQASSSVSVDILRFTLLSHCIFQALELIADIYEKEGRIADAHNYMQRVVALDPSNFRACRDLARLETMLRNEGRLPGYVPLN